jgi:hypothetical protein
MRYRLRTLMIVMLIGGPLGAWGYKAWLAADWQAYVEARAAVETRRAELAFVKARSNGSLGSQAAERHTEMRLRREDEWARERSTIYRLVTPKGP